MALEEELPETPEDKTVPKFRQIDKRVGEYINEWQKVLEAEARHSQKARYGGIDGTDVKRGSEDDEADARPKKRIKTEKKEETLTDMSTDSLKRIINRGDLSKHTVGDLKDWLKVKGLNSSGKKQDLVDRIEQWAEEN